MAAGVGLQHVKGFGYGTHLSYPLEIVHCERTNKTYGEVHVQLVELDRAYIPGHGKSCIVVSIRKKQRE